MGLICRLFPNLPGCRPPDPVLPPEDPGPESPQGDMASDCVNAMNVERLKHGLQAFSRHDCLANQAQQHCEEMAASGNLSHNGFSGRLSHCNIGTGAENVAAGYSTGESVTQGWMTSPGHRKNLLKGSYRQVGVGYVADGRNYNHWWCAVYTT